MCVCGYMIRHYLLIVCVFIKADVKAKRCVRLTCTYCARLVGVYGRLRLSYSSNSRNPSRNRTVLTSLGVKANSIRNLLNISYDTIS